MDYSDVTNVITLRSDRDIDSYIKLGWKLLHVGTESNSEESYNAAEMQHNKMLLGIYHCF